MVKGLAMPVEIAVGKIVYNGISSFMSLSKRYANIPFTMLIMIAPPIFIMILFKLIIFARKEVITNINTNTNDEVPITPPENTSAKYPRVKAVKAPEVERLLNPR